MASGRKGSLPIQRGERTVSATNLVLFISAGDSPPPCPLHWLWEAVDDRRTSKAPAGPLPPGQALLKGDSSSLSVRTQAASCLPYAVLGLSCIPE